VSEQTSPKRENLIRAVMPGVEFRDTSSSAMRRCRRRTDPAAVFARFNEWTEINSMWEGNFMERFARRVQEDDP
jgi:hypothetical protein